MLSRHSHVLTYGFCCFFLLYESILQISFACFIKDLQIALYLSEQSLSILSASYFVSYALFQILVANFINIYSFRAVFLFSCLGLSLSTYLFSISSSFEVAVIARFLMGASSCAAFILVVNATKIAFKKRYLTLFIGLSQLISASFVVFFQAKIAAYCLTYYYTDVLRVLSLVGLIFFLLLFFLLKKEKIPRTSTDYSFMGEIKSLLLNPKVYLVCFYSFFLWGPVVGISALWGPMFLTQKIQIEYEETIFISSLIFFGLAFSSPIIGALSINKQVRKKIIYLCPLFGFFAALIFILQPNFTYAQACMLMVLMGASSAAYEVSYALIRECFYEARCNLVMALNNMAAIFGVAFFQLLVGLVLELSEQNIQLAGSVIICFYASAFFLSRYILQSKLFTQVNEAA